MKYKSAFLLLAGAVFVAGCGPSFTPALNKGETIPQGKVLVIGKFIIDPPKTKPGEETLEIKVGMTFDLSQQIKEGSLYSPDEAIAPLLNEVFYFPLPAGARYIRTAQVMKVIGHQVAGPAAGMPLYDDLKLYRNIKLDIPANARAVYIGTIIYKHAGKRAVSVTVHDEYDQALLDLSRMKIPGIKSSDVVKKIAAVK